MILLKKNQIKLKQCVYKFVLTIYSITFRLWKLIEIMKFFHKTTNFSYKIFYYM